MNIFDFKCKYCGGELEVVEGMKSVGRCIYCGSKQTIPKLESEKRAILFDRANHLRRNNEFDKAESLYEQLLNEDPTDPEAYWSLVLCKYGIEYVEDARTKARIPTVNRMQYTSILADENYKSAIAKASPEQKQLYEEEALTINGIQKGILEIANKEEPFDIFICYKETDENGKRSKESFLAHDLYHELTRQGYKVFFARITLQGKLGVAYEPYIFSALNSSKVMVVLGTQKEHFEAVWVRNEWSRFLGQIKNGEKKILIPAYKDMDAYDLPVEFSHLQALDMSRFGFMYDLIDSINAILKIYKPKETVVEPIYRPTPINHEAEKPAPAPEKKQEPISRPSPTNYETQPKAQPTPIKKVEPISRPNPTNYGTQPKAQPASTKKPSAQSSTSAKATASDKKKKSNKALIIILIACTVGIIGLLAMMNNSGNPTPENKPVVTTPATTVYDGTEKNTGYVEDTSAIEQETVKEESVGLEYELNDDGDGYIVYKGSCTDTDVVIPAKHKGIRVTGIGSNAFKDYEDLESIIISEGVMFISDSAFFGCTNLTSVTLPNSMASIGVAAFADCTSLKDIVIPNDVYKIETYAFSGCTALENIYFNGTRAEWNGIIFGYGWDQETGNYTVHCSDDAPETETTEEITTVIAEETTVEETTEEETTEEETTEEETTEEETTEVQEASVGLKYTLNGDSYSVSGIIGTCTDTNVVIPSTYKGLSVTAIGNNAFKDCTSITTITIPDSVTSIGAQAFYGCKNLTSITIPDSVTSIESCTFIGCRSLTSMTIPDSVTSIGIEAFRNCSNLTSITIPDSVTSIGSGAFSYCSNLTSITIPDSVTSIGNGAFNNCSSLTSITIPDSVTSIGEEAFYKCDALTSITMPDSVTSIEDYAFYYCASLTSIYFNGTKEQWDSITKGSGWDAYTGGSYTVYYLNEEPMPEDTEAPEETIVEETTVEETTTEAETEKKPTAGLKYELEENSYKVVYSSSNSANSEIVIPSTYFGIPVTSIGDYAFDTYLNLTSITIPDSITSIGEYAFYYCTSLTSITIPGSVTSIGDCAFRNCESLTSIYFNGTPAQWNSISFGEGWNSNTGGLTVYYAESEVVTGPASLSYTLNGDSYSVSGIGTCTDTEIIISSTYNGLPVTSIGDGAFKDCTNITSVIIPDSVTSIGEYAFSDCYALTSIIIPDGVTSIGNYAFEDCIELTSIVIPNSVKSIGDSAFYYCNNLQKIYYGGKKTSEWSRISIGVSNESLTNATIYYYSSMHDSSSSIIIPGEAGLRYWYYVDGVVTERPAGWPFVQSPV